MALADRTPIIEKHSFTQSHRHGLVHARCFIDLLFSFASQRCRGVFFFLFVLCTSLRHTYALVDVHGRVGRVQALPSPTHFTFLHLTSKLMNRSRSSHQP